jgi:opacity protein-like surface antigen
MRMRRTRSGALLAAGVAALLFAPEVEAQQPIHAGAHLAYGLEDFSKLGVGVHATYPFTDLIAGAGSFTVHFPGDGLSFWDLNLNAHYRFPLEGNITPYAGGGLNYARLSFDLPPILGGGSVSSSEVGLNVLGGAFMDLENDWRLFGEARFVISDADQLVLTFGVSLPLGGN